jgi:hypothetical protein
MKARELNKEDGREKAQKPQKGVIVFEPIAPFRGNRLAQSGSMQSAGRNRFPLCRSGYGGQVGEGRSRPSRGDLWQMGTQRLIGIQDVGPSPISAYFRLIQLISALPESWACLWGGFDLFRPKKEKSRFNPKRACLGLRALIFLPSIH